MNCILIHLTLPLFEHVTCMQMTPFLSALGLGWGWGGSLNSLMPLSAGRYNQSAEVMGLRAPQRLHRGLNVAEPKHKANPLFPAMEYRSMDKASLLVHCLLQSESPNREDAIRVRGMQKQISQSDWVARHAQIKPKICKRGIPISCDCIKNSSNLNCSSYKKIQRRSFPAHLLSCCNISITRVGFARVLH